MVSLLLDDLVPHNEKVVGNTWNGVGNVFEKPGVLGFPLSNCVDSYKVVIIYPKVDVLPSVLETILIKLHGTSSPPTLRVKCRVLKISKCTWSGCHVVALP
jgi:hypothetical protein